jgi:hypothetical protein
MAGSKSAWNPASGRTGVSTVTKKARVATAENKKALRISGPREPSKLTAAVEAAAEKHQVDAGKAIRRA